MPSMAFLLLLQWNTWLGLGYPSTYHHRTILQHSLCFHSDLSTLTLLTWNRKHILFLTQYLLSTQLHSTQTTSNFWTPNDPRSYLHPYPALSIMNSEQRKCTCWDLITRAPTIWKKIKPVSSLQNLQYCENAYQWDTEIKTTKINFLKECNE